MTPIEFVSYLGKEGLSDKKLAKTSFKRVVISDGNFQYQVLSYYYSPELKAMCLDIEKKEKK